MRKRSAGEGSGHAAETKRVGRKLLVASLGVAAVSYGACGSSSPSNTDAAVDVARAEDAGPDRPDGSADAQGESNDASDAALDRQFTGNLIPY